MRFLTVAILAVCAFGPAFAVDDGVPPIPIIVGLGPSAGGGGGGGNATTLEGKTWEAPGTIGSTTPNTGAFTTLTVGSAKFSVDANGNIIKLNNLVTSFPSVQGTAGTFLQNDGAGNLSWVAGAAPSNAFGDLTSSTNTTAAMVVGTGASLAASGSGTIAATSAATASAAPFSGLTGSTNSTAAMVVGTGASLATSGSGTIAATSVPYSGISSGTNTTGTLVIGTGASLATSGSGTIAATTAGSATTAGAVPFSGVTSSTNTTGALVVGTGGSLGTSGSGTINATALNGATFAAPGTIGGGTPGAATFTGITDTGLTPNAFIYSGTAGLLTNTGAPTDGQLLIGSTGAAPVRAALTAGSNVTITPGAGSITIAAAGSATPAFSALTSGTNNGAAMVLGTGSSLTTSGSGTNNATTLNGATFAAPGAIGGGTPGSVAATTISATGQITSTLATGTAPLVIASTTNVPNLNASSLSGATFASPGSIGSVTPSDGAFTTLSAGSGKFTVDANGNVTKLNNVTQSWPAANAAGGLINDGAGNLSWTTTPAITLPWSSITAPAGNLSLAMANRTTAFAWDTATTGNQWSMSSSSLSSGGLVNMASTSTAAASNTQTVLGVATSGINSNSAQTTYGADVANTHTGTSSTNIALRASASGGSNNYAMVIPAGDVGFQTSVPTASFENAANGALSKSAHLTSGTWITGGSATTTKPQVLIEPAGATSTAWNTAGTGLGVNGASGFTGDLINLQSNGTARFSQSAAGRTSINTTNQVYALAIDSSSGFTTPFGSDTSTTLCLTNVNTTVNNWCGVSFGGTSGTGANAVQAGIYSQISNHSVGTRANNLVFYTATGGAATERMQISPTGLVGIGTVGVATAGLENKINGAVSQSSTLASGTWFTGGSATTTKPQVLIEPAGTTSTSWSTSGTGLGINAASGFAGTLISAQVSGGEKFALASNGDPTFTNTAATMNARFTSSSSGATGGSLLLATSNAGSSLSSGDRMGGYDFRGQISAGTFAIAGGMEGFAESAWSGSSAPTYVSFLTTPAASITRAERMRISSTGLVGIGTGATPVAGLEIKTAGAASQPAELVDGAIFTGGSATTTKPQFLVEPAGTASTAWSTSGTAHGINAGAGFAGNLIDAQVAASSKFKVDASGNTTVGGKLTVVGGIDPTFLELAGTTANTYLNMTDGSTDPVSAANQGRIRYNSGTQQFEASLNGAAYATIGGGGGAPAFSAITSGTNTGAAMVVGSGASIAFTGTGIVTAPRAGDVTCFFAGPTAGAAATSSMLDTVAIGSGAAGTGTAQSNVIAIGSNADNGGSGNDIIAIGNGAVLKGGNKNVGIGTSAIGGASLSGAIENVVVGYNGGSAITSGQYNSMLGSRTGVNLTTGSADILLGANAGFGLANSASNTLVIGDTNVHATNYAINTVTIMSSATGGPTWTNANIFSVNGAASASAAKYSGSWFTGGSATTTKPQLLVEASGAASTGWSTNGTGIGGNAATGFTGNLLDLQVNGVSQFSVSATGGIIGTLPWNSLAVPNGNLSLAMANRTTAFAWDTATTGNQWVLSSNSLSSGVISTVNCTSTAAASNTQQSLRVTNSGINANANQATYGMQVHNTKSGTGSTDIAALFNATNGDSNYGIIVQAGDVGFQTNTPVAGFENAAAGQLSKPGQLDSGTWITGGNAATCKPYVLVQPTGTSSSNWSTSGTGFGLNAANAFAGNLIDAQVSGTDKFKVTSAGLVTAASDVNASGNLVAAVAGKGLQIKEGSNARMGTATLVAGTITVANTSVTANTRVLYSVSTVGGVQGFLSSTQSAATSFTINSSNVADTSTVVWELVEPAP